MPNSPPPILGPTVYNATATYAQPQDASCLLDAGALNLPMMTHTAPPPLSKMAIKKMRSNTRLKEQMDALFIPVITRLKEDNIAIDDTAHSAIAALKKSLKACNPRINATTKKQKGSHYEKYLIFDFAKALKQLHPLYGVSEELSHSIESHALHLHTIGKSSAFNLTGGVISKALYIALLEHYGMIKKGLVHTGLYDLLSSDEKPSKKHGLVQHCQMLGLSVPTQPSKAVLAVDAGAVSTSLEENYPAPGMRIMQESLATAQKIPQEPMFGRVKAWLHERGLEIPSTIYSELDALHKVLDKCNPQRCGTRKSNIHPSLSAHMPNDYWRFSTTKLLHYIPQLFSDPELSGRIQVAIKKNTHTIRDQPLNEVLYAVIIQHVQAKNSEATKPILDLPERRATDSQPESISQDLRVEQPADNETGEEKSRKKARLIERAEDNPFALAFREQLRQWQPSSTATSIQSQHHADADLKQVASAPQAHTGIAGYPPLAEISLPADRDILAMSDPADLSDEAFAALLEVFDTPSVINTDALSPLPQDLFETCLPEASVLRSNSDCAFPAFSGEIDLSLLMDKDRNPLDDPLDAHAATRPFALMPPISSVTAPPQSWTRHVLAERQASKEKHLLSSRW